MMMLIVVIDDSRAHVMQRKCENLNDIMMLKPRK